MAMRLKFRQYDITIKIERYRGPQFYTGFDAMAYHYRRLGPVSITIEDAEAPVNAVCADCGALSGDEGLKTVSFDDEGLSYCWACKTFEPNIEYLSKRQLEKAGYEVY
jgi:hypothetical protein